MKLALYITVALVATSACAAGDKSWKFDVATKEEAMMRTAAGVGFDQDGVEVSSC